MEVYFSTQQESPQLDICRNHYE